ITTNEVKKLLINTKNKELGNVAIPLFTIAKKLKKSPQMIASEIAQQLVNKIIQKVNVVGAYVNIYVNQQIVTESVLQTILKEKDKYGSKRPIQENVVIDFSSPNIAKLFSMGHLRSTVIGNALANMAEKNGYNTVRINHLGDWGTQLDRKSVV